MGRFRQTLFGFVALAALAQPSGAAPAPLAKTPRTFPTPNRLLADFRAEGYTVKSLERGPQPGSYVVTVPSWASDGLYAPAATYAVSVKGPDVRAEIRAVLQTDYEQRQRQAWGRGGGIPY
jgi:hypothetical protein